MMKRIVWLFVGVSICHGCGTAESSTDDSIAGTYVREHSREILNQLSGSKVGMRTVRDTLYIISDGDSYQVKNSRWRMNDYDNDGWQNMEHGESGPLPDFKATYNKASGTLKSDVGLAPELVIAEDGRLSVGNKSEIAYTRVD